jgi:hypothetical protein
MEKNTFHHSNIPLFQHSKAFKYDCH